MSDPYRVLGVSPNATDEEVKTAYREMAKKYHPDNYSGSPIADLASEKMKEVNEAYDEVMAQRKNQQRQGGSVPPAGNPNYGGYQPNYQSSSQGSGFGDVRSMIINGRIADAEQILDGVPPTGRNAEWYFLKGTVLYKRGWLEEASNNYARACQMDPQNAEYRSAMNQINNQRSGSYGGYNPNMQPNAGGCNACDCCSNMICADCCCECMGGDLIPCC